MAGMTKVQAVSYMLMAVRQNRVSALDPSGAGGTSDSAYAEAVLNDVIDEFIVGWHPNTTKAAQEFTASGAGEVDVGANPVVLAVRGVGKIAGRRLTLRGTKVYDEGPGTTQCFGNTEKVLLDIAYKPSSTSPADFEDLDPKMKVEIRDEATRRWRLLKAPDPQMDEGLQRIQEANSIGGGGSDPRSDRPPLTPPFATAGQTVQRSRRNPLAGG